MKVERINLKKSEVRSLLQQVTGQLVVVLTLTQAMLRGFCVNPFNEKFKFNLPECFVFKIEATIIPAKCVTKGNST